MSVYHQEYNTNSYLYQENLPSMTELTACFLLKRTNSGLPQDEYFISIAVPSQSNEFLIGWNIDSVLEFWVDNAQKLVQLSSSFDMNDLVHGWHRHCFTYKTGGSFKVNNLNLFNQKYSTGYSYIVL